MANKLIISNSLSPQYDLGVSDPRNGVTYTNYVVDSGIGTNGGQYTAALSDAKAIKYTGVCDQTGAAALTDGAVAFEGTATTAGTEPSASGVNP